MLLDQPDTIAVLQKADPGDPGIVDLIVQVKLIDSNISTVSHFQSIVHTDLICPTSCQIEELLHIGLGLEKDHSKSLYIALKTFSDKLKNLWMQAWADVSHREKQSFVSYDSIS